MEEKLLTFIDECLQKAPGKYQVLEGDDNTLYVKDLSSGEHLSIHVNVCD